MVLTGALLGRVVHAAVVVPAKTPGEAEFVRDVDGLDDHQFVVFLTVAFIVLRSAAGGASLTTP